MSAMGEMDLLQPRFQMLPQSETQIAPHQILDLSGDRTGRDHLANRSRLQMRISKLAKISSILIVDDSVKDAEVLASSLRLVVGHDVQMTHVQHLRAIGRALAEGTPDVVFLDDRLGHATTAEVSLSLMRASGYTRPVIIMSGLLTRTRQIELVRLGVADVVHKDDRDTARLSEAILRVFEVGGPDEPSSDLA
jgi:CheY-like chemotaxis protein